jgi:hypothetical protein
MSSTPSTVLLALPLLFLSPRADEVTFGVAQGAKVTKTFEIDYSLELEELKFSFNDQEHTLDDDLEMNVESKTRIVFTDAYREMGDGRPKVLARTFDELTSTEKQSGSSPAGDHDEAREEESDLEGATVVFTWSDEESRFERKLEGESKAGEELLGDLVEDADLRGLLPGRAVAEGDTWEIAAMELAHVFDPSGDVALRSDEDDESDEEMQDELVRNYSGDAKGTFKGYREEDGVRVAVLALEADIVTYGDREKEEGEERFDVSLEVEGELLWDVAAKRAHSLSVTGPARLTVKQTGSVEGDGGQEIELVQTMLLGGTMTVHATWKPAE